MRAIGYSDSGTVATAGITRPRPARREVRESADEHCRDRSRADRSADLGPTLLHEHIFVMEPRPSRTTPTCGVRATGTRRSASRDAITKLRAVRARRDRHDRRPERPGSRAQHRRAFNGWQPRSTSTSSWRPGSTPFSSSRTSFLPADRRDCRVLRARDRGRDRRHRRQGGIPQVLRGGARIDRRRCPVLEATALARRSRPAAVMVHTNASAKSGLIASTP